MDALDLSTRRCGFVSTKHVGACVTSSSWSPACADEAGSNARAYVGLECLSWAGDHYSGPTLCYNGHAEGIKSPPPSLLYLLLHQQLHSQQSLQTSSSLSFSPPQPCSTRPPCLPASWPPPFWAMPFTSVTPSAAVLPSRLRLSLRLPVRCLSRSRLSRSLASRWPRPPSAFPPGSTLLLLPSPRRTATSLWVLISRSQKNIELIIFQDSQLEEQLAVLNENFAPQGISFTLAGTTRTINTNWADDGAELAMKKQLRKGDYGTLNVYFQREIGGNLG